MFTGIIEEIGKVKNVRKGLHSSVLEIQAERILEDVKLGDSIAVNGVCLTVTSFSKESFTVDVMHETLRCSSLMNVRGGSRVNLERAMKADGRFGGHIVSGHIDGQGIISRIQRDDNAVWFYIDAEADVMKYIVRKGSITIDGISLTVAKREDKYFAVSIIPFTLQETILQERRVGDVVNLETDLIGRYIEQFLQREKEEEKGSKPKSRITKEWLLAQG